VNTHEEYLHLVLRQHGVVSRSQLADVGLTSKAILHRVARGQLAWLSPRVLAVVGAPDTPARRAWAATLDVDGGCLALGSSLWLWGQRGWALDPVHVVTTRRPHRGLQHLATVHSSVRLTDDDIGEKDGLRATTPARTLLDLSSRLHPAKVEDLCDDLLRFGAMSVAQLHEVVEGLPRRGGLRGYRVLARLAAVRDGDYRPTDSKLERRFERILEDAGEAPFERQVEIGDDEGWIGRVDFVDRRRKLVVEIQSQTFHSSLSDRRRDAARIARLRAAGWTVLEVTEQELWSAPSLVVDRVRAARRHASSAA
jgi:very-short-patch-repair endonuclease